MDFPDINTSAVLQFPGNNVLDFDQLGSDLIVLSSDNTYTYITVVDLTTNTITIQGLSNLGIIFYATNINFLDSSHAVIHSTSSASGAGSAIVTLSTLAVSIFSGSHPINQNKLQQMATYVSGSNSTTAYISNVATSGNKETYGIAPGFISVAGTVTEHSLGTANNINCVIVKPSNGISTTHSFLLGCQEGVVIEVNSSGTTLNTITLPTVPGRISSGPSPVINMSWDSLTNSLFITGSDGTLYKYYFSGPSYGAGAVAPTLVGQWIVAVPLSFTVDCVLLSNCYNGHFLTCPSYSSSSTNSPVCYWSDDIDPLMMIGKVGTQGIQALGLNATTNVGWYISAISGSNILYAFPLYNTQYTTVETRAQYPSVGTDVAARILRINYFGSSYARVELDTTISPGPASLTAKQNQNYYEIALIGTQFVSEKFDVRTFEA